MTPGYEYLMYSMALFALRTVTCTISLYPGLIIKIFNNLKTSNQKLPVCPCFRGRGREMTVGQVEGWWRSYSLAAGGKGFRPVI